VFALVRTDTEARKQEGISFLLIDLRTPGITIRPIHSIDGEHHLNEVFFDEVRVPVGNLVGQENKGWDCAKFLLSNERTGIANVGLCRERLDYARELAGRYTQAGKPLLDDPKLRRHRHAGGRDARWRSPTGASCSPTASRSACRPSRRYSSSRAPSCSRRSTRFSHASSARAVWSAAPPTKSRTVRLRRAISIRAQSIYGGTTEVQKDILAKAIVG
jgi:pimeloyl-CoA dehydrogenase